MQITSRFTIAIHMLTVIGVLSGRRKTTSEVLASSVQTNPVVIRRILQQLKTAGLVEVTRGSGGALLKREPSSVTLFDIYLAVDCVEKGDLFHFHENPSESCPIGRNIHAVLDDKLSEIQKALENEMKKTTLADIVNETEQIISRE